MSLQNGSKLFITRILSLKIFQSALMKNLKLVEISLKFMFFRHISCLKRKLSVEKRYFHTFFVCCDHISIKRYIFIFFIYKVIFCKNKKKIKTRKNVPKILTQDSWFVPN